MKAHAEALYSKWDKGLHPDDSGTIPFTSTMLTRWEEIILLTFTKT